MELRFPLDDITITMSATPVSLAAPLWRDRFYTVNQHEFSMDVKGVAHFYASGGDFISVSPYPEADEDAVGLYLNGSVYGAILHQRKILPMHGSCFSQNGAGVMICGDAGAGKSSLTASFCSSGALFLTDDITPLIFEEGKPYIRALSDRIKLWGDTLKQLEKKEDGLTSIYPQAGKYYYPMDTNAGTTFHLSRVYIIEIKETEATVFEELSGSQKFAALRGEIYRHEYLNGMPENEAVYFQNLIDISGSVRVFRIKRPAGIRIQTLREQVSQHMVQG